jgi:hypothetical protein
LDEGIVAVTPGICPSCGQPVLEREALLHLQRVKRQAERALTVAAEQRAVLMAGSLRRKLHQQREALRACR